MFHGLDPRGFMELGVLAGPEHYQSVEISNLNNTIKLTVQTTLHVEEVNDIDHADRPLLPSRKIDELWLKLKKSAKENKFHNI
jgi:hypothetical protein